MKWVIVFHATGANKPSKAYGPFDTYDEANDWCHRNKKNVTEWASYEIVKMFGPVKPE